MSLAAAPRFSVVIPLYNKAAYVREAVDSVLAQTHPPFEIIVVDDGSTDGGAALVKDLAPGLLRVVRQDNAGVAVARNRGIAEAQGDHIAFLDADDSHDDGYLAAVATLIAQFPQAGVHATGYRCAWPDGRRLTQSLSLPGPALISDFYRQWCNVTFTFTSAITVRRSLLLSMDIMFPPGERLGEDQDLWFRLAERSSLAYDPRALVEYRMEVSDSATASIRAGELLPCYRRLGQRLSANQVPPAMQAGARRLLAAHYINTARVQPDVRPAQRCAGAVASTGGAPPSDLLAAHLAAGAALASGCRMKFSLVLASYGRTDDVGRLIASLAGQTERRFELIVADQNRDERLVPYLAQAAAAGIACTHLRLAKPNLSAARNAGIAVAQGEWLAFPDDDCWYEPSTLAEVLVAATLAPESTLLVADWPELLATGYGHPTHERQGLSLHAWRQFRGGDASSITLFVRCEAAQAVNGFDSRLGVGLWFGAGEETDFVLRLLEQGAQAGRAPRAHVHHACKLVQQQAAGVLWRSTLARERGGGALYAKHAMPPAVIARGLLAPVPRALMRLVLCRGDWQTVLQSCAQVWGRWQGWQAWPKQEKS